MDEIVMAIDGVIKKEEFGVDFTDTVPDDMVVKQELKSEDDDDLVQAPVTEEVNPQTVITEQHDRNLRSFTCTSCSKSFQDSDSPNLHASTHSDVLTLKCSICGKDFLGKWRSKLNDAVNKAHRGQEQLETDTHEKPHICNICFKEFSTKSRLISHLNVHNGQKPHQCNYCDFGTNRKDALTVHLRKHTGEKPYKCLQCEREFAYSCTYKIHLRTHTGEKPFECNQCGRAFTNNSNLQIHIKAHNGIRNFKCTICLRGFLTLCNLKAHMKTHVTNKIKKRQCGTILSSGSGLRTHKC